MRNLYKMRNNIYTPLHEFSQDVFHINIDTQSKFRSSVYFTTFCEQESRKLLISRKLYPASMSLLSSPIPCMAHHSKADTTAECNKSPTHISPSPLCDQIRRQGSLLAQVASR